MGAYARSDKQAIQHALERVNACFPILAERRSQLAGTLSGGEQQMLAIGRAIMAEPALMLLDEPSLGLAPMLVEEIFRIIGEIHASGTTVLLVEQNANKALSIADYGYVLETGTISLAAATVNSFCATTACAGRISGSDDPHERRGRHERTSSQSRHTASS